MCAALPACKPFFSRHFPAIIGTTFSSSKPSENSQGSGFTGPNNLSSPPDFSKHRSAFFETTHPLNIELHHVPTPNRASKQSFHRSKISNGSREMWPLSYLSSVSSRRTVSTMHLRKHTSNSSISTFITYRGVHRSDARTPSTFDFDEYDVDLDKRSSIPPKPPPKSPRMYPIRSPVKLERRRRGESQDGLFEEENCRY